MPDLQVVSPTTPISPIVAELTKDGPTVTWLVPQLLPQGNLTVLAGLPGCGKSYLSYYLGLAAATGSPFLGFPIPTPLRVCYFDQENSQADRIEYEKWAWNGLGRPSLALLGENFWPFPFHLGSRDWATLTQRVIEQHHPDLLIFDTATPAFDINEENDNGEATRTINQIRRLQALSSACAIVLKHTRIDKEGGNRTIRGAKAWISAVDGVIFHVRNEGRPRTDGLSATTLDPDKVRAFGLRHKVHINPEWVPGRGLRLQGLQVTP